jgi:hypothetical protein
VDENGLALRGVLVRHLVMHDTTSIALLLQPRNVGG